MLTTSSLPSTSQFSYSTSASVETPSPKYTCYSTCYQHTCPSSPKHPCQHSSWVPTSEVHLSDPSSIPFPRTSTTTESWQHFQSTMGSTSSAAHCCPGCWISWKLNCDLISWQIAADWDRYLEKYAFPYCAKQADKYEKVAKIGQVNPNKTKLKHTKANAAPRVPLVRCSKQGVEQTQRRLLL